MSNFEYIVNARTRHRLTQKELSEKTGISLRTIQRIEGGEVTPRPYTITKIEEALNIDHSQESIKSKVEPYFSTLSWIFISSLFLPVVYSVIAFVFWKNQERKQKDTVRDIIYLNLITACLAIPILVVVTVMILRSFDIPVSIKFLPLYIPVYWFYSAINLWWTLKLINEKRKEDK